MAPCVVVAVICLSGISPRRAPLHLGFEATGARVVVINTLPGVLPAEASRRLALVRGGHMTVIHDLNGMRGAVRIRDGASALRFVRLLTSPATWYLWGVSEVEVVGDREAASLPNYGLIGITAAKAPSGFLGVIPERLARAAGFTRPVVRATRGGYQIVRWLYTEESTAGRRGPGRIEKVEETVNTVGSYSRRVLASRFPPRGVLWQIPTFE